MLLHAEFSLQKWERSKLEKKKMKTQKEELGKKECK
jgi:hypothetical protein